MWDVYYSIGVGIMPDNSEAFEDGGSADPAADGKAAVKDGAAAEGGAEDRGAPPSVRQAAPADGADKTAAGHKKRRTEILAFALLGVVIALLIYINIRLPSLLRPTAKPAPADAVDTAAAQPRRPRQAADAEPEAPARAESEGAAGSKAKAGRAAQKAEPVDSSGENDRQKGGTLSGKRSRMSIQRVVVQNSAALRYAYNKRLSEKPELTGRITVKFAIDEFGGVIFAQSVESTMGDSEFESVVVDMVKGWKFEAADNPGDVTEVTYPFVFSQ